MEIGIFEEKICDYSQSVTPKGITDSLIPKTMSRANIAVLYA